MPPSSARRLVADVSGQALVLLLGVLCAVLAGAAVVGSLARGLGAREERQRAADLAALAAGHALQAAQARRYEPAWLGGRPNPRHLTRAAHLAHATAAARATAARNGAVRVSVSFPGGGEVPDRVRVVVRDPIRSPAGTVPLAVLAEAHVSPDLGLVAGGQPGSGEHTGPLAVRQGKRMRPDVALAFDRMAQAARAAGIALTITSAHRSDAEQAALWARNPDPRWVAPPGRSLHRLGTELDLAPRSAYPWLAANARRYGFVQRYAWEWWHWGFTRSPASASAGFRSPGRTGVPAWVPAAYAAPIRRASTRWGVGAALLAAQLWAESRFDPRARSPAGAQGIAQFLPATARAYGLRDPLDPVAAIDAQAHLLHDLLRRFGSVPLALAAYNAGPARVAACACVPPLRETQRYVARVLARIRGADLDALGPGGPAVRLVR